MDDPSSNDGPKGRHGLNTAESGLTGDGSAGRCGGIIGCGFVDTIGTEVFWCTDVAGEADCTSILTADEP